MNEARLFGDFSLTCLEKNPKKENESKENVDAAMKVSLVLH